MNACLRNVFEIHGFVHGISGMTFNNKLAIWSNAVKAISESPLIGHGILPAARAVSFLGWAGATHAHDLYLEIAFEGGLISIFLFIITQIIYCRKIMKINDIKVRMIFIGALIAYDIMGISEAYVDPMYYLFIIIGIYFYDEKRRHNSAFI